jgi:hypothetical protein
MEEQQYLIKDESTSEARIGDFTLSEVYRMI